ncbi:MAG TPA: tetratricopeptide repeat protein, partial [Bryobacteraceae bacterium]|nr:tetratricopeptide repeat protein [Bryobacteraceae bacterium]
GLIHLKRGEIAAGIGALEHALEANPANPDATLTLASAYVSSREIAKAEALLSRAQLPNSPQQQLVRGALLHARGDYKGAAQAFSESLARRPGLPTAHSQLGLAFMMLGEHSRAAAQFNAELDQNPGDYAANANLGLLYLQDKKYADARALLDKAREVRPGDPGLMYLLAQVRSAEGQHQLAAEALEQVVEGRPGFIPAHVLLARTYARLKRTEESRRVQATIRRLTDEEQKRNLQGTAVYSGQTSTAEPAHAGAEVTQ